MDKQQNKPVRINTRVSARANDWLDKRSKEMAISKSALVAIAIENYIKETEVVYGLPAIADQLEKIGLNI